MPPLVFHGRTRNEKLLGLEIGNKERHKKKKKKNSREITGIRRVADAEKKKRMRNKELFDFYSRNYLYPDYRSSSTAASLGGFVVSFFRASDARR